MGLGWNAGYKGGGGGGKAGFEAMWVSEGHRIAGVQMGWECRFKKGGGNVGSHRTSERWFRKEVARCVYKDLKAGLEKGWQGGFTKI